MTTHYTRLQRFALKFADYAFGPKKPWANLPQRRLVDTMPADVGACVMCLYLDGAAPEPWIVIGERPDPNKPGATLYNGSGGGFGNLRTAEGEGEQPAEMAIREWNEENRTAKNEPVCSLDAAQLRLIENGVGMDYRAAKKGGLPVAYTMFYTTLDAEQKAAVKLHAANMEDADYRAACFEHSGRETARMRVMRLADAVQLPANSFAHPHEARAVGTLQAMWAGGKLAL